MYANEPSRNIDPSTMEFPFLIDQICIDGSRFFDMIRYYDDLCQKVMDENAYKNRDSAKPVKGIYAG